MCLNNSKDCITGNSGGSIRYSLNGITNAYNTANGVLASTTANIYGVYDMTGGTGEYAMGALADATNTNEPTVAASGFTSGSFPDSKYYNLYKRGLTPSNGISNYSANAGIKGDAIYEVSTSGDGTNGWGSDYSNFMYAQYPWSGRGRHI